ncbi:MAG: FlgO family outer membrane protein [Desulfobacterales bacterium]|nr:FlgO family outer membrane protein [Desulfobacterales bacterium]
MKKLQVIMVVLVSLVSFSCATHQRASSPVPQERKPAIAVWDLENLSPLDPAQADLGDLLSAKIMETVRQNEQYTLVERQQLQLVLRELNLGSSSLADASTQLRIGKMVGARLMIFGAYQVIANQMRLDLRIVEVETGRILKATEKTVSSTDLAGWLTAAEAAAKEIIRP